MSLLIAADLHFTDNVRDAYRWDLFPWLIQQVQIHGVKHIFVLGDMTDAKDRHSAKIVNKLTDELYQLSVLGINITILRGNHDGLDPTLPFFSFLDVISNIRVITEPSRFRIDGHDCLFLPNTADYERDWTGDVMRAAKKVDFIFTHQSYDGCRSENGTVMRGVPPDVFSGIRGNVWSGDIHVPQKVGCNIEYVGSPYRVRFGDTFRGRVVLINRDGSSKSLYPKTINRHSFTISKVEHLDRLSANAGDQVKIRVELSRAEYPDWPWLRKEIVAYAKAEGWELFGPELIPIQETVQDRVLRQKHKRRGLAELVEDYADDKKFSKPMLDIGMHILDKAKDFS